MPICEYCIYPQNVDHISRCLINLKAIYLRKLCGHDDFVTGIHSKGQALRVAVIMDAMFSSDCNGTRTLETTLNKDAVNAAN